ncbi:alpha/beta hydrolase [Vacuolonema iberomarrocanum]|uniref:alpha/beta hydrolase n=1 Tax=Vacuolonema iberomarrocanum TaxID=3454632 RepID=UPI0019FDB68C|nr:alpha/beta hydrolase [filamentous cyanobacterium LEGE 07170]
MKRAFGLQRWTRWFRRGVAIALTLSLGGVAEAWIPRSGQAAEQIQLNLVGPATVSVSIESLRVFAETGEVRSDLRLFTNGLDEPAREAFRQVLLRPIPFDAVSISNISYSPLGRDVISQVSEFIRVSPEVNGFNAIRAAAINAAVQADEDGWTALDALAAFPTERVEVEVEEMLALLLSLVDYGEYNDAMIAAVRSRAATEAAEQEPIDLAQLPDLSLPGAFSWVQGTVTVNNPALGQTREGLTVNYDYDVDFYVPEGLTAPAPIVIISHGFGALKENFIFLAEHLASHGYIVLAPDHVGSNLAYRQTYLQGQLNTLLSPVEFVDRPQEISFLIDEMERLVEADERWQDVLDLERIAVIGDSLGATAALALGGATFDIARLREVCQQPNRIFSAALYLQCRAQFLPPTNYELQDERVRVAIAAHMFGYGLFGPDGMAEVDIPLMVVSGSQDILAPAVLEQFYPFMWLENEPRYLAMLDPGTHFSTKPEGAAGASSIPSFLIGSHGEFGQRYYQVIALAFLNAHLREQPEALPYLTAAYADHLSADAPMQLDLIRSLSAEDVEAAYGRSPLYPLEAPSSVATVPPDRAVLTQIATDQTLRVAMRRDAPPFGFLDGTATGDVGAAGDRWTGYCVDLVNGLAEFLGEELNIVQGVVPSELPSTVTNRYTLIREGTVHLECGPNGIRSDLEGVQFSQPIAAAGTRLLIPNGSTEPVNPNLALTDVRLGVVRDTNTEAFVRQAYPEAEIVAFEGVEARQDALQALADGSIAALAEDDILLLGEAQQLGLDLSAYEFVPKFPLTCEFYGLALPAEDPTWRQAVNAFLESDRHSQIFTEWFGSVAATQLDNTAFCLNR